MDALSDVLSVVRLRGGVFLNAEFTAPWCIFSQIGPEACGALLEGSDHLVIYHYVVEGRLAGDEGGIVLVGGGIDVHHLHAPHRIRCTRRFRGNLPV